MTSEASVQVLEQSMPTRRATKAEQDLVGSQLARNRARTDAEGPRLRSASFRDSAGEAASVAFAGISALSFESRLALHGNLAALRWGRDGREPNRKASWLPALCKVISGAQTSGASGREHSETKNEHFSDSAPARPGAHRLHAADAVDIRDDVTRICRKMFRMNTLPISNRDGRAGVQWKRE